jgi:hypothetical protein
MQQGKTQTSGTELVAAALGLTPVHLGKASYRLLIGKSVHFILP